MVLILLRLRLRWLLCISLSPTTCVVGSTVTVIATKCLDSSQVMATFGSAQVTLSTSDYYSTGGIDCRLLFQLQLWCSDGYFDDGNWFSYGFVSVTFVFSLSPSLAL